MSAGAAADAGSAQRGRTTLTAQALRRLATGLVADASGASAREVAVRWEDARGGLHAAVTLPFVQGHAPERTLAEQGAELRAALTGGMADLAGRRVEGVDLRYSGVRRVERRRVR
jgi:hypothetical protein